MLGGKLAYHPEGSNDTPHAKETGISSGWMG